MSSHDRVVKSFSGVGSTYDRVDDDIPVKTNNGVMPIIGLDLGQVSDSSALALLERRREGKEFHFAGTYLHRWKIGTTYPAIVEDVVAALQSDAMQGKEEPVLAIDATGVGRPVADMFRDAIEAAKLEVKFQPIVITGGHTVNFEHVTANVPKRLLVSVTQATLQMQRVKFASKLPEAQTLAREMQAFQLTLTESKNDTYEGRAGAHDDLVLAVAMALWAGHWWKTTEYEMPRSYSFATFDSRSGWWNR